MAQCFRVVMVPTTELRTARMTAVALWDHRPATRASLPSATALITSESVKAIYCVIAKVNDSGSATALHEARAVSLRARMSATIVEIVYAVVAASVST